VRHRKTGRRIFLNRFKEPRLNTASPDVVELAKALVKEMDSQNRHASSPGLNVAKRSSAQAHNAITKFLVTPSPFLYIKPRMILNNQIRNI